MLLLAYSFSAGSICLDLLLLLLLQFTCHLLSHITAAAAEILDSGDWQLHSRQWRRLWKRVEHCHEECCVANFGIFGGMQPMPGASLPISRERGGKPMVVVVAVNDERGLRSAYAENRSIESCLKVAGLLRMLAQVFSGETRATAAFSCWNDVDKRASPPKELTVASLRQMTAAAAAAVGADVDDDGTSPMCHKWRQHTWVREGTEKGESMSVCRWWW